MFSKKLILSNKEWIQESINRKIMQKYIYNKYYKSFNRAKKFINSPTKLLILSSIQKLLTTSIIFMPYILSITVAKYITSDNTILSNIKTTTLLAGIASLFISILNSLLFKINNTNKNNNKNKNNCIIQNAIYLSSVLNNTQQNYIRNISSKDSTKNDYAILYALKCIEETVNVILNNYDNYYFNVTLTLFKDDNSGCIYKRSSSARYDTNGTTEIKCKDSIAYYASKYITDYFLINYFKSECRIKKETKLEYKSLSTLRKPKYESILALPLTPKILRSGVTICKGCVTIDAAKPYEFYGHEHIIRSSVQPYLNLINDMLYNWNYGIKAEQKQ